MEIKIMKKIMSILFALIMIFALTPNIALANNTITVTVNGQAVVFADQGPVIVDGRTLVPVAGVFQALGFTTQWHPDTRQVTINRDTDTITLTIGSRTFTTNSTSHTLDVPAQIIGGRTMLPIAVVLRSVGYEVNWDGVSRTVAISYGAQPINPRFTIEDYHGPTPAALELVFEDGQSRYYLSSVRSNSIMLTFTDGQRISLREAMDQQKVTIAELIASGLTLISTPAELVPITPPPQTTSVTMRVQNATSSGISFVFENPSNNSYTFGSEYILYVRNNGTWEQVEPINDLAFVDIGNLLPPNTTTDTIIIDWQQKFGELQSGEYRFLKEIIYSRSPGDFDKYILFYEFIL